MHGRLKVKTSAEKQAENEKERDKKKLLYQGCMKKIRHLYQSGDRSVELLSLIKNVLENIPEFATLWNWRKNVLLSLFENVVPKSDHNAEDNNENIDQNTRNNDQISNENTPCDQTENKIYDPKVDKLKLIEEEKYFVARCLEANPKAYSLWSHRRWLVELHPSVAVLTKELELCDLFLKYDERNFHCWDYRRYITKLGGITRQAELDKTTSLIERNFSNYSAWHYRSTLLDTNRDVVNLELDWTQNAYFTDPSDQSVWLYYQWLLGRQDKGDGMLVASVDRSSNGGVTVLLQKTQYKTPDVQISILSDDVTLSTLHNVTWTSNTIPAKLWYCNISVPIGDVTLKHRDSSITIPAHMSIGITQGDIVSPRVGFTAPTEIANEQLANIQELYALEPDNKWCMLTLVNMLNVLHPLKTKEQITELRNLTVRLCQVDPMRTGYYRDLWSNVLCQTAIETWWHQQQEITESSLNLSKKYLTLLPHTEYLFTLQQLDLSHNNISSFNGFSSLLSLNKLDISHNKICTLQGIESCKNLSQLDISHNHISNTLGILPGTKCRIRVLSLIGNPVTNSQVYPNCVLESFVMLCTLDNKEL